MDAEHDSARLALTSRRGFVVAASLGTLSLYALWGVYDAAPFVFSGSRHGDATDPPRAPDEHGGHGSVSNRPSISEFQSATDAFITRFRLPDGSVRVDPSRRLIADHSAGSHASHGAAPVGASRIAKSADDVIYLLAKKWLFEPDTLHLALGTTYRFRIMAVDASHGASMQLGRGSRIIRLRQGAMVEQELSFTRPGEYLVYCTIYCGIGHDRMSGRIIVS